MQSGRLGLAFAGAAFAAVVGFVQAPDWPFVTPETRPWTRWWWLGSAVDETGLTAELEAFRAAGIGGVEITPIYGVQGAESRFVPFLSDRWMRLLEHTLREAQRLDLGVDVATGTGWPFGGPWVGEGDACRSLMFKTWTVEGGERLTDAVRLTQTPLVRAIGIPGARAIQIGDLKDPVEANENLQALALEQVRYPKPAPLAALVAYSPTGQPVDLTARVDAAGRLDWVAPAGTWTLYGAFLGWHGKLVERAAPGGEGNVIDHFSRDAIRRYLVRFDRASSGTDLGGLRAFFNDSYEVDDATGQADGTPALFEEFQRRRGYDLRDHLPALAGSAGPLRPGVALDYSDRVRADYRETLSDLLLGTFTTEWTAWARRAGRIVRNQAHGSPANLLDLYAASDIPETEGTELPRFKWATSAAHVAGRRLVSAEAATWLGEHFRSTLADVRADVNRFFVSGVNHIVYHGTAYSPASEPWPGWLFYASVEFNQRNPWWEDFGALNAYVTRVQSFLQAGEPDQDVLLYYPFYDSLGTRTPARLTHFGGANVPSTGTAFEKAGAALQGRGYTYDYISDRQLAGVRAGKGSLTTTGGGSYKTLVVPASRFMPLESFETILSLARNGATVVAFKGLPDDVAGLADLERRRAHFRRLRDGLSLAVPAFDGISETRFGRGVILRGDDLETLLARAGVSRERLVDSGLEFARRRIGGSRVYFIMNPARRDVRGWVALDDRAPGAVLFDPMSGRRGDARARRSSADTLEIYLALAGGESVVAQTTAVRAGEDYPVFEPTGNPIAITGAWGVRFVAGGPELPSARTIESLGSWIGFPGDEVKRFSGTAVYTAAFTRPVADATAWQLDLGRVHDSARVRLNGRSLGTLIGPSFRVTIDPAQLSAANALEVRVTNLMANRIAALDEAGVRWKKFYNINFPARFPENRGADGLFSAAKWESLDSGLLGPVTLTPLGDPSRAAR